METTIDLTFSLGHHCNASGSAPLAHAKPTRMEFTELGLNFGRSAWFECAASELLARDRWL